MASPRETITQIDKLIDANRNAVKARVRFCPSTAREWQAAWDANPFLRLRDHELFRQRGIAQLERDEADHKVWQAQQRSERRAARKAIKISIAARKCPTCGCHTLAQAA